MTINFRGYVFDDAGNAVSGASVKLLDTGTSTQEGSTDTTDSNGLWNFDAVSEADAPFDVEITKGSSVRRIRWNDQIHLKEIDVRNNTGATTPALTAVNFTNNASNQAAVFRSDRGTDNAADNDATYVSFNLRNDNNEEHEFARITATAIDVSNGNEDGRLTFSVATGTDGGLDDIFIIDSSTGSAATISYEVDSFTIKGGEGEAGVLYLFADQGDDAGDEWKINIADGGVMTFGNDIASAGTYVTHMTVTPHATITSSSVTFPGILDVNGSVDWDVSDVQVDSSGDIDLVSTANSAAAIYLQENGGTSGTIKIHADQGTSVTEGAESINILSDAGGIGIRSTANLANAILLTADGGTSETIVVHADQGTGTGSIELLSDVGGIELDAGTDIILDAGGADIFLKDDGTLFGTLTNSSGELVIKSSSSGTTAATFSGANVTLAGTVTVGADGSGTDVIFYSGTAGDNLTWDASEEVLQITGTNGATALDVLDGDVRVVDTLYFYDRGGESISSDGSNMTISGELIINQGSADAKAIDLRNSDVSHAMTGLTDNNTYFSVQKVNSGQGGVFMRALTDGASQSPFILRSTFGSASPSNTAIIMQAAKSDGSTGEEALAATEQIFDVSNYTTVHLRMFGNGRTSWSNGGYLELIETSAPGAGAANSARIYALQGAGDNLTDVAAVFQDGSIDVFAQESTPLDSPIFTYPSGTEMKLVMRKPHPGKQVFEMVYPGGESFVLREIEHHDVEKIAASVGSVGSLPGDWEVTTAEERAAKAALEG